MLDAMLSFWLVAARVGGMLAAAPLFTTAPVWGRLALSLMLSALLLPAARAETALPGLAGDPAAWLGAMGAEALVGLLLGFTLRLMLGGVHLGGALVDMQMGISLAAVYDAREAEPTTLISQLWHMTALLVIMSGDLFGLILQALGSSLRLLPPGAWAGAGLVALVQISATIFSTALLLALPLVGVILVADLILGVMTRSAPQINIFSVGIPLKSIAAVVLLALLMPRVAALVGAAGEESLRHLERLLRAMAQDSG